MTREQDERHRFGQHYTPQRVARLLAAFAVRASDDLVFDPSCGDGRLLRESLSLKAALDSRATLEKSGGSGRELIEVFGIDRSAEAVALAAQPGAIVTRADFFDIEPGHRMNESTVLPRQFDAIIGNPPYIRQEVVGAADKQRIARRLAARASGQIVFPKWSGRSDMYVYFFAQSAGFLKPGGRLVFLTAGSWMSVGYGSALKEFLLSNFRLIAIIESALESFFSEASVNTVITVLEREADARSREANLARFVELQRPLAELTEQLRVGRRGLLNEWPEVEMARLIEQTMLSTTCDGWRVRVVQQSSLASGSKARQATRLCWGTYLRASDVFFSILEREHAPLRPLGELADLRYGVKTGANEFFYLRNRGSVGNGPFKPLAELASVRRGVTTGANEFFYLQSPAQMDDRAKEELVEVEDGLGRRHELEAEYLSPVVFSLKEIPGILLEQVTSGRRLLNCSMSRSDLSGRKVLDYIRSGEAAGYDRRPTCATRNPWYAVLKGWEPAPLLFPSKVGERWLIAVNRARVFEDKKLYGLFPAAGVSARLLATLLNSTWARYYTELTCRQLTGAQAIADIDVVVAEQIMLPDPRTLKPELQAELELALEELCRRPIASVFEEVTRADRCRLDELVLMAIGFTEPGERKAALDDLYEAVVDLVRRRIGRARTLVCQ